MEIRTVRRRVGVAAASAALLLAAAVPVSALVLEDQVQEAADSVFCVQPVASSACYNGAAQTVTVGRAGELTAVHLLMSRADFVTADVVVELHAGAPDGAILATSDPVPATEIPVSSVGSPPEGALSEEDWVLFSFPAPPTVAVGDIVAIVLPFEPLHATTDVGWGWAKADADVYGGGTAFGGSSGSGWSPYEDGSDFAFATYVAAGEPTCELSAWMGDEELAEPVEVAVGETFDLWFEDFPPFGDMVVTYAKAGADPEVYDDAADAFGDSWWTWEAEVTEIGDWVVTGEAVGTACGATLDVTIVAAPAPTPTPTATPSGGAGTLTPPPTSTMPAIAVGGPAGLSAAVMILVIVALGVATSARVSARRT